MLKVKRWRYLLHLVGICAVVLLLAGMAEACPTCKNAIADGDPHHQNVVAGYYYSILFMMSMPFLLLGTFSSYMYLEVRRSRKDRRQPEHVDTEH